MLKLSELQKELFNKLEKYPILFDFFGDRITQRLLIPDWLENPLVQIILKEAKYNIDIIEGLIKEVKSFDSKLTTAISSELSGSEPDYDIKIKDQLAELNAASWIISKGYTEIQKLIPNAKKTPDFQAQKPQKTLFEVKNFRSPSSLFDLHILQLEVRAAKSPELYKHLFLYDFPPEEEPIDDSDKLAAVKFIQLIEDCLREDAVDQASYSYQKQIGSRLITKKISCNWRQNISKTRAMGHGRTFGVWLEDPNRPLTLIPLIRKTWTKTEEAIQQLTEYDLNNEYQKWVLINWQKPSYFIFQEDLQKKYKNSIDKIDEILKQINKKINIQLL